MPISPSTTPWRQVWQQRRRGDHEQAWQLLAAQLPAPLAPPGPLREQQRQLLDAFLVEGVGRLSLAEVLAVLRRQHQAHGLPDGPDALEALLAQALVSGDLPTALSVLLQQSVLAGAAAPPALQLQLAETLALLQHRPAALAVLAELLLQPLAADQRSQAHGLAAILHYRNGDRPRCLAQLFEAVAHGSRDPIQLQFLCRLQCETGALDAAAASLAALHEQGLPALALREQRLGQGLALARGLAEPALLETITAALAGGLLEEGAEIVAAAPALLHDPAEVLALRDALLRNRLRQQLPLSPAAAPAAAGSGGLRRLGLLAATFQPDSPGGRALALAPWLAAAGVELVGLRTLAEGAGAAAESLPAPVISLAGLDAGAALALARDQAVEGLIDLVGWHDGQRHDLLQQRLAPLQLGWFATDFSTGLDTVDYLLVDRFQAPPLREALSEGLLVLPGAFLALTAPWPPLPLEPHAEGALVVAAPARHLQPAGVRLWAEILRQQPDRVLAFCHADLAQEVVWQRLLAAFAVEGIAADRLLRAPEPGQPLPAALLLDPWPWGHWPTALAALQQGVPVQSRRGPALHQRRSAGLLELLGLAAFVADDGDTAVAIAAALLADRPLQEQLHRQIPQQLQASLLHQPAAFAAELVETLAAVCR